ncbi:hypothetical protein IDH60_13430 [Enterococcus faecalis]|nr:hypothetical protein [Enterococcus faecalis]MBW4167503.1 hypothetical protein [Enterococcus faecalis]HAP3438649.1 hypothetical protein [Enterococcus faecalis]HAP3438896.1 hypothetical protein [Enterococcus faecalis]
MEVTRNIKKISKMIGIDLLDHIIIGNGDKLLDMVLLQSFPKNLF